MAVNACKVTAPTALDVVRLMVSSSLAVTAVVIALPNKVTVLLFDDVSTKRVTVTVLAATVVAAAVTAAPTLLNAEIPPAAIAPCTVVNVLLSRNTAIS